MKNIIILSKSSWNTYNFRKELIEKIIKKKFNVIVCTQIDEYSNKLKNLGCEIKNINFNNTKVSFFLDVLNIIGIIRLYIKYKPKYVLSFNLKPIILSNICSRLLRVRNISMITGLGSAFDNKNLTYYIVIFLYKIALKNCYKVFLQNKHDYNFFLKKNIIKLKNSDLIPGSGVNLNKFFYKKINHNEEISFLCVARLLYSKGIIEYCEAAKIIKKNFPDIKFKLIGEFDKLKRGIQEKKIYNYQKDNIITYLSKSNDIVVDLHKSSCVILPSHREGTPKILLEAMSAGRPIITSDAIGCEHLINEGKNGFKFKLKNIDDLVIAIKKYINLTINEKNNMSQHSRQYVEDNFDVNTVINKYMDNIIINEKK